MALSLFPQGDKAAELGRRVAAFLRNTSLCEFERSDGRWRMLSWDQVPHLAEPEHEPLHSHY